MNCVESQRQRGARMVRGFLFLFPGRVASEVYTRVRVEIIAHPRCPTCRCALQVDHCFYIRQSSHQELRKRGNMNKTKKLNKREKFELGYSALLGDRRNTPVVKYQNADHWRGKEAQ